MNLLFPPLNLAVFHDGNLHGDGLCVYELYSKNKYIPYFFGRVRWSKGYKGNAESDSSRVWVSLPVWGVVRGVNHRLSYGEQMISYVKRVYESASEVCWMCARCLPVQCTESKDGQAGNGLGGHLVISFYTGRNGGLRKWSEEPKIFQQVNGRPRNSRWLFRLPNQSLVCFTRAPQPTAGQWHEHEPEVVSGGR